MGDPKLPNNGFANQAIKPIQNYNPAYVPSLTEERSKYDVNAIPGSDLNLTRAHYQPVYEQLGRELTKLVPKIALGTAEQVGYLLDLNTYANLFRDSKTDMDNWLSKASRDLSSKLDNQLPTYTSGQAFDDSGWWISGGSNLISSVAQFALVGEGLGLAFKSLAGGVGATNTAIARSLAKGIEVSSQPLSAALLTHVEGVQTGQQVYKDVFDKQINLISQSNPELSYDQVTQLAHQKASEAAAVTVQTNYWNVLLNYTSLSPLFRSSRSTRNVINQDLRNLSGETLAAYTARVAENYTPSVKRTLNSLLGFSESHLIGEVPQEALEEGLNVYAQRQGELAGGIRDEQSASLYNSLTSKEGMESMFWGALGGLGNTLAVNEITGNRKKENEDKQKYWNTQRQAIVDNFGNVGSSFARFTATQSKLKEELSGASITNQPDEYLNIIKDSSFAANDLRNFQLGTTESLYTMLDDYSNMTNTQEGLEFLVNNNLIQSRNDESIENFKKQIEDRKKNLKENERIYLNTEDKYKYQEIPNQLKQQLINEEFVNHSAKNTLNKALVNTENSIQSKINDIQSIINNTEKIDLDTAKEINSSPEGLNIFIPPSVNNAENYYKNNLNPKVYNSLVKNSQEYKDLNQLIDLRNQIIDLRRDNQENLNKLNDKDEIQRRVNSYNEIIEEANRQKEEESKPEEVKTKTEVPKPDITTNESKPKETKEDLSDAFTGEGIEDASPEYPFGKPQEVIEREQFIERIKNGEDLSSPEDLQYYENNKEEIEKELKKTPKSNIAPPTQSSEGPTSDKELNKKTIEEIEYNEGRKLIHPFNVARNDVNYVTNTRGYKDEFTQEGDLIFNQEYSGLNNTSYIQPGMEITFKVIDEGYSEEEFIEKGNIEIYLEGVDSKIGNVHLPEYANTNKIANLTPELEIELKEQLRLLRKKIFNGLNKTKIIDKSYGYVNNSKRYTTLSQAFGQDLLTNRVQIGVYDGNKIVTNHSQLTYEGGIPTSELQKGASLVLIPNNNGNYLKWYIQKSPLGVLAEDSKIFTDILEGISKSFELKEDNYANVLDNYLHVLKDNKENFNLALGKSTLVFGIKDGKKGVKINNSFFTEINEDLIAELKTIYPTISSNVNVLSSNIYLNEIFNSPLFKVSIQGKQVILPNGNTETTYFHQTRIDFSISDLIEDQIEVKTEENNIEDKKADIERRRQEELKYWQAEDRQKRIIEGRETTKKVLENLKKKYPANTFEGIAIRLLEKIIDFNTFSIINSEGLKLPGGQDATKFGALATGEGMAMRQDRIDALLDGDINVVKTFIHELVHTFTKEKVGEYQMEKSGLLPGYKAKLTEKEKKAVAELERIYNKVKEKFPTSTEYGLTNLDEFLAEAFSNSSFQGTLSELKSEGKTTSLFKEWLNVISDLFYEGLVKWSKRFNKSIPQKSEVSGILEDIMGWTEDLVGEELLKLEVTTDEINAKYDAELKALEQGKPEEKVADKKADIERRRQADLDNESFRTITKIETYETKNDNGDIEKIEVVHTADGKKRIEKNGQILNKGFSSEVPNEKLLEFVDNPDTTKLVKTESAKEAGRQNKAADKINAKYDSELAALENKSKEKESETKDWNEVFNINNIEGYDSIDTTDPLTNPYSEQLSKILIDPENINSETQDSIIKTIAFRIINNKAEGKDNKSQVKTQLEDKLKELKDRFTTISESKGMGIPPESVFKTHLSVFYNTLKNYDKFYEASKEYLNNQLGTSLNEEDYYETLEEEDKDINQFDAENTLTEDRKRRFAKEIKKKLLFIPKYKLSKDNKYIKELHPQLMMETFSDVDDLYIQMASSLSGKYYSSDINGLNKMISILETHPKPEIKEFVNELKSSSLQTKIQFYTVMNQNYGDFKSLWLNFVNAYEIPRYENDVLVDTVKFLQTAYPKVINSNSNEARDIVIAQWKENFINSNAVNKVFDENGLLNYQINLDYLKTALKDLKALANNDGLVRTQFKDLAYNDDKLEIIKKALSSIGITMDSKALGIFLDRESLKSGEIKADQKAGLNRFIDNLLTPLNKEFKKTDETVTSELEFFSPFTNNLGDLKKAADIQFLMSNNVKVGSFRYEGKSLYSFIRHNPLSEIFTKLQDKESALSYINSELSDPFKANSTILNQYKLAYEDKLNTSLKYIERISVGIERGTINKSEGNENIELKNQVEKLHELSKVAYFTNQGSKTAYFMMDTLSDKTVMPLISLERTDVFGYTGELGNINLHDNTLNKLYNYFLAEVSRINSLKSKDLGVKGYSKLGHKFFIYTFLNQEYLSENNPELNDLLFKPNSDILKDNLDYKAIKPLVLKEINKAFNIMFENKKQDWIKNDVIEYLTDRNNPELKQLILKGIDSQYLRGNKKLGYTGVESKLGLTNKTLDSENVFTEAKNKERERALVYSIIDYVVNYSIFSNEMLMLTGDPALMAKEAKGYKYNSWSKNDNTWRKEFLKGLINTTNDNISKRNASLAASGERGVWKTESYNTIVVNDIKVDSPLYNEYLKAFESVYTKEEALKKADKYKTGDETDAQEYTTVEEHLATNLAFGLISEEDFRKYLYMFDKEAYDEKPEFKGKEIPQSWNSKKQYELALNTLVFQPKKPVQVGDRTKDEVNIKMYIKTSSVPLIPKLLSPEWKKVLDFMKDKQIQRLNFESGVKVGSPEDIKSLFKDGKFNPEVLNSEILTLNRDSFRIQLDVPFAEDHDHIREGTQLMKLMFVDLNEGLTLPSGMTVKEAKKLYNNIHKEIYNKALNSLIEEIGAVNVGNSYRIKNLSKLAEVLRKELNGRNVPINTVQSLIIDEKTNNFLIPLSYLGVKGQLEPVLSAIITNRLIRNELPGKSYVQGSESIFRGLEDLTEKDKRSIVWTKEEYRGLKKLNYISKGNNQSAPAQIILPFYFTKEYANPDGSIVKKQIPLSDYVIDGILDTSKIDPELLEINGFRIPTQGPNSNMWFEVVGFLPKEMNDLVIVPSEIVAQMGSDFDVDKLYTYNFNYEVNEYNRIRKIKFDKSDLKSQTKEQLQNGLIEIHKDITLSPDRFVDTINTIGFDHLEESGKELSKLNPKKDDIYSNLIFNPDYQRKVYFDNRGGQLGIGISANANVNHAHAQNANLFIRTKSILFKSDDGKIFNDGKTSTNDKNYELNSIGNNHEQTYDYAVLDENGEPLIYSKLDEEGTFRLDKVYAFNLDGSINKGNKISENISEFLSASTDNAKEKLLSLNGINKYNFNVAITLVRAGIPIELVIPFINQPILKDYFTQLENLESIEVDYTPNKKDNILKNLFGEYIYRTDSNNHRDYYFKEQGLQKYSEYKKGENLKAFSKLELDSYISEELTDTTKIEQLEVLKAFLYYETISASLGVIQRALNTDVKGLPKNVIEINDKANQIADVSNISNLGNVEELFTETVSGVYSRVPEIASQLFGELNDNNYLFNYNSPAYQGVVSSISEYGRYKALSVDKLNHIYNHLYYYLLTDNKLYSKNISKIRNSLNVGNNIQNTLQELKDKYSTTNDLINNLTTIDVDGVKVITINNTVDTGKEFSDKITSSWLTLLNSYEKDPSNPLYKFAKDLTDYTLSISPQEFGSSSLIKYLPISDFVKRNFQEFLKTENLEDESFYNGFILQFIQHNPNYANIVKQQQLEKVNKQIKGDFEWVKVKTEKGTFENVQILNSFYLPAINSEQFKKQSLGDLIMDKRGHYYPILSYYQRGIGKTLFINDLNEAGRYIRIDLKGMNNFFEYNKNKSEVTGSVIPKNKSNVKIPTNTSIFSKPPSRENYLNYYSTPTNINDVLDNIILRTSRANSEQGQLFNKLAQVLQENITNNIPYVNDTSLNALGRYSPKSDKSDEKIRINLNKFLNSTELEIQETILHEIVHALTINKYNSLDSNSALKKEFNRVYETYINSIKNDMSNGQLLGVSKELIKATTLKVLLNQSSNITYNQFQNKSKEFKNDQETKVFMTDVLKALNLETSQENFDKLFAYLKLNFKTSDLRGLKEKYYAYTSPLEFMTMVLTNEGFQNHLKTIETSNPKTTVKESLFQRFMNFFKELFGIKEGTYLYDAVERVLDIIKSDEEVKQSETKDVEQSKELFDKTLPKVNIYAGTNENAELSNFAIRPFEDKTEWQGLTFKSVEGAFQAAKIQLSDMYDKNDNLTKEGNALLDKLQEASGVEAKALGRKVSGLNTREWDRLSSKIMKGLLLESFKQNPKALEKLLSTGNAELTHTQDKGKWGKEFPKLLMEVRQELKPKSFNNIDTQSLNMNISEFMKTLTKEQREVFRQELGTTFKTKCK